jgi:hypothetical protein
MGELVGHSRCRRMERDSKITMDEWGDIQNHKRG